jgi:hypothetical protein
MVFDSMIDMVFDSMIDMVFDSMIYMVFDSMIDMVLVLNVTWMIYDKSLNFQLYYMG